MKKNLPKRGGQRREVPAPWDAARPPLVALVGRPNVGKSTLFNRVTGGRSAIVEDRPGTTRDRKYAMAEWDDTRFIVCDTGGFEPEPDQPILAEMRRQTQMAIEEADVVVFVTDARAGLNPADTEIAEHLRRTRKPTVLAVNKVDGPKHEAEAMELHGLGLGDLYTLSAAHGTGVGALLDAVKALLPAPVVAPEAPAVSDEVHALAAAAFAEDEALEEAALAAGHGPFADDRDDALESEATDGEDEDEAGDSLDDEAEVLDDGEMTVGEGDDDDLLDAEQDLGPHDGIPRIAVIGRPNAGKSTIINRLLGEERLLTFHEAGTTRDAIDAWVQRGERRYLFIDTAGIRRQRSVFDPLEKLCINRSLDAIDRADVTWLLIDAAEGITEQDAKVASFAHDKGKGLVLVVNKWDLTAPGPKAAQKIREEIARKLAFLSYAPIVTVSARTGARIERLLQVTDKVFEDHHRRIPTGRLNRFFKDVLVRHPPPSQSGRLVKLYFITQVSTRPPTFIVSVNYPRSVHFSYQRYVVNQLREAFGFEGVPIRAFYRRRGDKKE